jgi:p21-activated kinase 1
MEIMRTSLTSVIKKTFGKMTEKIMAFVIREVLQALSWLHKNNRVHRDVKSSNILISESGDVKLTDFGISCQLTSDINQKFDVVGTPCWMAPELITSNFHDCKADIWSLGIVLLELCEQNPPHIEKERHEALELIANGPAPSVKNPKKWSKHLMSFFKSCVNKIPEQRPTADELLRHVFISRVGADGKEQFTDFVNTWVLN